MARWIKDGKTHQRVVNGMRMTVHHHIDYQDGELFLSTAQPVIFDKKMLKAKNAGAACKEADALVKDWCKTTLQELK